MRFVQGDLVDPLRALGPFDVIVANLPYVPAGDVPPAPHPVSFEPRVAVDGGPDGLDLYRRLAAQVPALAAPGATLFFEAAPPEIDALAALVQAALPRSYVEVGQDYDRAGSLRRGDASGAALSWGFLFSHERRAARPIL